MYIYIFLIISIIFNFLQFSLINSKNKLIYELENKPIEKISEIKYIDKYIYLKPTQNENKPIEITTHESDPYTVYISSATYKQKEIYPVLLLNTGLLNTNNNIDLFCGISYNISKDWYININSNFKNKHNFGISVKIF